MKNNNQEVKNMDKKILGSLMAVFVLLIVGVVDVESAACTASSCTPVCAFTYPSQNDMDLGEKTVKSNTTMVVGIQETTTSTYANITSVTITPYQNSSNVLNSSEMAAATVSSVIFDNLDDGDYKLTATIFYENASANGQNLTLTQADCGSRTFRVNTRTGSANYPELLEEVDGTMVVKDPSKNNTFWLFGGIVAVIAILIASDKLKK